jgi:hypothetical protein
MLVANQDDSEIDTHIVRHMPPFLLLHIPHNYSLKAVEEVDFALDVVVADIHRMDLAGAGTDCNG